MAGYTGTFLRINLSTGQIDKESLDLELATKFIGGRGLASYFLTQEVDPEIEPLDPATNLLLRPVRSAVRARPPADDTWW